MKYQETLIGLPRHSKVSTLETEAFKQQGSKLNRAVAVLISSSNLVQSFEFISKKKDKVAAKNREKQHHKDGTFFPYFSCIFSRMFGSVDKDIGCRASTT
jgi:hypothetical protein